MRCRQCDYSLWGLKPGPCPECGTPFRPSDHQLPLGGVRFCCPGCHTAYYGTSMSGHLIPTAFTCVQCGQDVEMDEMILEPVDANVVDPMKRLIFVDESTSRWDHGYFELVGLALGGPQRLMTRLPKHTPLVRAVAALFITLVLVACANLLMVLLFGIGIDFIIRSVSNQSGLSPGSGAQMLGVMEDLSVFTLKALGIAMLVFFVWAVLVHGLLRLMGGGKEGFRRTFQAIFFTSTVFILSAISCVGFVAGIWWLISSIIALTAAHRGQVGRALIATFLTCGILFFGTQAVVVGFVFLQSPSSSSQARAFADSETLGLQLFQFSRSNGRVPGHILSHPTIAMTCIQSGGEFFPGVSEDEIWNMTIEERSRFGAECAEVMPGDTIAYRVGDVVITCCQFDPSFFKSGHDGSGDLWIAVGDPIEPIATTPGSGNNGVFLHSITPSGGQRLDSRFLPSEDGGPIPSEQELQDQNAIRASLNLEPLPPPSSIPPGGVVTPSGIVVPDWPELPGS